MGWDANTSLSAIDGVLQLAASAEMELGEASDMVTDYLAAFGMEASQATEMADMMAYAQANSNTSARQLGEAFGNSAAGLHAAGQEMDTVTAILEGMANNGLKGSEAGTALNAVMAQITQKMKDGAIQIGETSVAVQDQDGNFRDLIDIMEDVETATDGMGTAERSAALAAVFNRTSLTGVNQILNEGVGKIKGYRDELRKSAGAADDMASTMQDNLQGDITEMNSALEGLGIAAYDAFGDKMRDGVQLATDVISGFTDKLGKTSTPLDDFVQSIDDGNRRVKESLDNANNAFNSAETDAAKLQIYKQALLDVADATETTEFQKFQVSQIVQELGGQIPELAEAWDEETGSLNLNADAIENLMSTYESTAMQQAYMDALIEAEKALADAKVNRAMASSAVAESEKAITEAGKDEKNILQDGISATQEYNAAMADLSDTRRNALNEEAEAIEQEEKAQALVDTARAAYDEYADAQAEAADALENTADAEEEAADGAEELADAVEEIDTETLEKLQQEAQKTEESIRGAMRGAVSAFDEFNAGAEVSKEDIIKNLDSQISGLENWSANMERLAQEAGSDMSQELYDYLAEMGPESANLVQTLVDTLDSDTDSFEEISEKWGEALKLSDNAEQIAEATTNGKALAEAYGDGITEGATSAQEAMQTMGDMAVEVLDTTKTPMTAKGLEGVMAFAQGTTSGTGTAQNAAQAVASSAASSATDYSGFYSSGSQSAAGLAAGIRNGRSGAVTAAINIMKAAVAAAKKEADIHSPSKKWEKEVGLQLAKGAEKGLKKGQKTVVKSAKDLLEITTKTAKKLGEKAFSADFFGVDRYTTKGSGKKQKKVKKDVQTFYSDIYDSAKEYMDKMQTVYNVSDKAELKYWQKVQKHLKKGTNAWYEAQKQIESIRKEIEEAKEKATQESAEKKTRKRETRASVQDDLLSNFKVYYEVSNKAEMQYWNKARKQFDKGTQERIDADAKYYEARKAYLDELTELNEDYVKRKAEIDKDLEEQTAKLTKDEKEKIAELKEAYSDAIASRKQDILSSMNLFEAWDSTGYTADVLIRNLKTQTEGLKLWEKEMNAIRKKALPKEFVDQLEEMGPDATASIYSLNRMTSKQLDEYVKMWKEKNAIAQRQAEAENKDLLAERDKAIAQVQEDTAAQISAITAESNKQMKALQEEYLSSYAAINTGMSDELKKLVKKAKKSGEDAVAGLIAGVNKKAKKAKEAGDDVGQKIGEGIAAGLKKSIKTAEDQATNTVDKITKAMKKAAKIKSPSQLFRDEVGAQIAAGVAAGMDIGSTRVEGSAVDMINAALNAAEDAQKPFDWEQSAIIDGIRALNAITEPQMLSGGAAAADVSSIEGLLGTLIQLVGAISERDQQIVLDSGELVGSLAPGISREMAAASIRSTRGRLA